MQLKTVFAITLSALGVYAGKLQDPVFYSREVAPGEFSRIEEYRSLNADKLGPEQIKVLEDVEAAIPSPEIADLPGLEKACLAAFDAAECKFILTGKSATDKAKRSEVLGRRAMCDCSDESDWCGDGFRCSYHEQSCGVYNGCGTLNAYLCDGLCIVQ